MEKKYSVHEIKKKISEYKKRLYNLNLQGFTFSSDIYDDIQKLEKKLNQTRTLSNRIVDKLPVILVAITILIIAILSINIFFPDFVKSIVIDGESDSMYLSVNSIVNGTVLNDTTLITGFAEQQKGNIEKVEIKIDNNNWEETIETNPWRYILTIDDFEEGNHTLFIRCYNGEKYKTITREICIVKIKKPIVSINNPYNTQKIFGIVQINGTTEIENGKIQNVEIRFDENQWFIISGSSNWSYNWNTNTLDNGNHTIEVRCRYNNKYSNITRINVTIDNRNEDVILPNFKNEQYFQLYFPPSNKLITPGKPIELKIYHRARTIPYIFQSHFPIKFMLELENKEDWMTLTIPDETITTKPIYETFTVPIMVTINEDAPMNVWAPFTIRYTFGLWDPINFPNINPTKNTDTEDIYIYTGQWEKN